MPKGGKREGAGRKAGGRNEKTRAIADQAAEQGITPLEVMISNMRFFNDEAAALLVKASGLVPGEEAVRAMKTLFATRNAAQECAKDAAPYMHPRLANIDQNISGELGTYAAKEIPVHEREPVPPSAVKPNGKGH